MVVAVKEPYGHTGKPKPPLDKGLFCSVEVKGAPSDPLAVIPRSAVHAGMVYLAGRESRLEIKPVTVKAYIKQYAIISEGISKGDILIVSDIMPAVKNMKLKIDMSNEFSEKAAKDLSSEENAE